MRKTLLSMILLFSVSLFAQSGSVLGIPDGTYTGSDVILSEMPLVPNVDFTTTRMLRNGIITARTRASLLGHEVGGASARLKVRPKSPQTFVLEDLDRPDGQGGYMVAGIGSCTQQDCSFDATVMNGKLRLRETWSRGGPNEFLITNGWQSLSGIVGNYSARLIKN